MTIDDTIRQAADTDAAGPLPQRSMLDSLATLMLRPAVSCASWVRLGRRAGSVSRIAGIDEVLACARLQVLGAVSG